MLASSSRLEPRPKAASRSTRWIHSAPWSCHACAASQGSPNSPPVPATPCDELDGPAARDVDGGQELEAGSVSHGSSVPLRLRAIRTGAGLRMVEYRDARGGDVGHSDSTQLRSRWAPASPDFSGWNWVAHSGPFSTAATNGAPCSAQVTLGATAAKAPSTSSSHFCAA